MRFEDSAFARFIVSDRGRALRVIAGLALLGAGLRTDGTAGRKLALLGLVPLSTGALDLCLLSPIFGGPVGGRAIRSAGDSSAR